MKPLILMLKSYSAAGISSVLRVELVLRSSLKYSAIHLTNQDDGSPFRLFTEEGNILELSPFNFLVMLKSSLVSFPLLAASASTHICSILLILSFTSDMSASFPCIVCFQDYGGFCTF